jgi:hypothetical protein
VARVGMVSAIIKNPLIQRPCVAQIAAPMMIERTGEGALQVERWHVVYVTDRIRA